LGSLKIDYHFSDQLLPFKSVSTAFIPGLDLQGNQNTYHDQQGFAEGV
jgi:hypothetical protein